MSTKTYSSLKTLVQDKLDLRDEDFIDDAEMLLYVEEAVRFCEAEIHKLNIEDQYFVSHAPLRVRSGFSDVDLPTNIYANKILRVVYSNGSTTRDIPRMRSLTRYSDAEATRKDAPATPGAYSYMLVNNSRSSGTRLRLFPTPNETSTFATLSSEFAATAGSEVITVTTPASWTVGHFVTSATFPAGTRVSHVSGSTVTLSNKALATVAAGTVELTSDLFQVWFIRDAEVPATDEDVIDFPEFWSFIGQHVVVNCLKKELGNPRLGIEVETLRELKEQMLSTLSNMVPDQDDTIQPDVGHYQDMGGF